VPAAPNTDGVRACVPTPVRTRRKRPRSSSSPAPAATGAEGATTGLGCTGGGGGGAGVGAEKNLLIICFPQRYPTNLAISFPLQSLNQRRSWQSCCYAPYAGEDPHAHHPQHLYSAALQPAVEGLAAVAEVRVAWVALEIKNSCYCTKGVVVVISDRRQTPVRVLLSFHAHRHRSKGVSRVT